MLRFSRPKTVLVATCLVALTAVPVAADVTVIQTLESSGPGANSDGEMTMYIKGLKMRQEQTVKGRETITILDIENKKMFIIDGNKNKAEGFDLSDLAAQQTALGGDGISVTMDATGETQTVAGKSCDVHNVEIKVHVDASQSGGMPMDVTTRVAGPVCLVADAPGTEDYQRFFLAMAEAGLFLGDPRLAQSQPGQQKGFSELYRSLAEKGLSYHSDLSVGFEGSGFMAKMLSKFSFEMESTVQSVSTEPLADSLFEVPAGVKVKMVN